MIKIFLYTKSGNNVKDVKYWGQKKSSKKDLLGLARIAYSNGLISTTTIRMITATTYGISVNIDRHKSFITNEFLI